MEKINVKPYAAMGAIHCGIDCVRGLQAKYPEELKDLGKIRKITMEMGEATYAHGGWDAKRPLQSIGTQMSSKYVAACQLLDGQVLPPQFSEKNLDRDAIWSLVDKIECVHNIGFDEEKASFRQRVTFNFEDSQASVSETREEPRGLSPPLSNEETMAKWRQMTAGLIDAGRQEEIKKTVLSLDKVDDIASLATLLAGRTGNAE